LNKEIVRHQTEVATRSKNLESEVGNTNKDLEDVQQLLSNAQGKQKDVNEQIIR